MLCPCFIPTIGAYHETRTPTNIRSPTLWFTCVALLMSMSMYTPFIFISNNNTDVDSRALQRRVIGSFDCHVDAKNNRCANSSCRECVGDVPKSTVIISFIVIWTHLQLIVGHLLKVFYFQFPRIFTWETAVVIQRTTRHILHLTVFLLVLELNLVFVHYQPFLCFLRRHQFVIHIKSVSHVKAG